MDFVTGFPKSKRGNDAIFVVIDKLTKVAHFLPIKESITAAQLAEHYTSRIVSLHGIPTGVALPWSGTVCAFWLTYMIVSLASI